jgi:Tfp pilus assembly protein PilN
MNENAIRVGDTVLDPTLLLLGVAGFAAFVLLTLLIVVTGMARHSAKRAAQTSHLEAELAELKSRLQTIAEISESRHEELTRATHRLDQNFTESWHKTYECFSKLNERMAVLYTAQRNLAVEVKVLTSKPGLLAAKRAFRRPLHR